jgi:hypothetical protein
MKKYKTPQRGTHNAECCNAEHRNCVIMQNVVILSVVASRSYRPNFCRAKGTLPTEACCDVATIFYDVMAIEI